MFLSHPIPFASATVHTTSEMQGRHGKRSSLPFQALRVLWSEKTKFVIIYFVRYLRCDFLKLGVSGETSQKVRALWCSSLFYLFTISLSSLFIYDFSLSFLFLPFIRFDFPFPFHRLLNLSIFNWNFFILSLIQQC